MLDDRPYMRRDHESASHAFEWRGATALIVMNVVAFVLQVVAEDTNRQQIQKYLYLSGDGLKSGYVWQLLTFQFLHANFLHILFNCLGIHFCGRLVEEALGRSRFLKLYIISGICGGLLQVLLGMLIPARFGGVLLGASAGVMGIMGAFAFICWHQTLHLMVFFVLPVQMRGRTLFWILIGMAVVGMVVPVRGENNIAHAAHLGGAVAGVAYLTWFRRGGFQFRRPTVRERRPVVATAGKATAWKPSSRPPPEEDLTSDEFISKEVDPILDKISQHGIQSLDDRERKILERARARMSKR